MLIIFFLHVVSLDIKWRFYEMTMAPLTDDCKSNVDSKIIYGHLSNVMITNVFFCVDGLHVKWRFYEMTMSPFLDLRVTGPTYRVDGGRALGGTLIVRVGPDLLI